MRPCCRVPRWSVLLSGTRQQDPSAIWRVIAPTNAGAIPAGSITGAAHTASANDTAASPQGIDHDRDSRQRQPPRGRAHRARAESAASTSKLGPLLAQGPSAEAYDEATAMGPAGARSLSCCPNASRPMVPLGVRAAEGLARCQPRYHGRCPGHSDPAACGGSRPRGTVTGWMVRSGHRLRTYLVRSSGRCQPLRSGSG